ncbi:MAG: hypothetical protein VR73_11790 [Gammaproteobacteria bacterium BRH_c0]|nr:MAG: hypothetical protein VR73_11790 [Gammaproteobacteria bacterium BRH_c0]
MIHFSLDELHRATATGGGPCAVWVPSEQVACHLLDVPAVAQKKWRAMVPWMLEERLLDRPDNCQFICGNRDGDGAVPVLVVARSVLAAWQRQVHTSLPPGSQCQQLIPDFFALPWQPGQVVVAVVGQRCLLRYGQWQGMAGPPEFIWPLVSQLLGDSTLNLQVFADSEAATLPPGLSATPVIVSAQALLQRPQGSWLGLDAGASASAVRASWPLAGKVAAGLALLLPVLLVAGELVETRRMAAQASHFEQALAAGYRQYFGMDYDFAPADFQRTVSRQLENRAGEGAGVGLALVDQLDQLLADCPDCRVDRLVVRDGQLQASLSGETVGEHLGPALAVIDEQQVNLQASDAGWLLQIKSGSAHE